MSTAPLRQSPEQIVKNVQQYCIQRLPETVHVLKRLVEAESPSNNKAAVDQLGEMLAQEFERLGGKVHFHPANDFGDHLQVDLDGPKGGKPVLILGHFDTVWDVGTLNQMPWRETGGRLAGPGVFDMKGGIAIILATLGALRSVAGGVPRPVRVLLNTDEEVGSTSSREVIERTARECAAALVMEPAAGVQGALKTARKGVGEFTVKVTGKASHSGLDFERGQSAILELAHQMLEIAKFTDLGRGLTVNPGVVHGGTRSNVIAAEAVAEVDVRISRAADASGIEERFRSLKPKNSECKLEILGGINRPPLERNEGVAALYQKALEVGRMAGIPISEAAVGGASDGNLTAGMGVPTLDGLGAVGDGAHAKIEYIVEPEIPRRAALLAGLLEIL